MAESGRILQVVAFTPEQQLASLNPQAKAMDDAMSESPTRPELDAKLEAIEARLETKVTRIEGKLDLLVETSNQVRTDARSLKLWIAGSIVTVIIAAVSTVIGVYGANASLIQSVIAAFESGRSIGQQQITPPSVKKN